MGDKYCNVFWGGSGSWVLSISIITPSHYIECMYAGPSRHVGMKLLVWIPGGKKAVYLQKHRKAGTIQRLVEGFTTPPGMPPVFPSRANSRCSINIWKMKAACE